MKEKISFGQLWSEFSGPEPSHTLTMMANSLEKSDQKNLKNTISLLKITEWFRLEGKPGGHQVQCHCSVRGITERYRLPSAFEVFLDFIDFSCLYVNKG